MKTETSAGGVIVQKSRGFWRVLLIKDMNNVWTFPKGKIEKGETRKAAAKREIQEEVGLDNLTYLGALPPLGYTYKRNGLINKTVYYYVLRYDGRKKPVCQKEEGIKDAKWVSWTKAMNLAGYPLSNKPILIKAQKILTGL